MCIRLMSTKRRWLVKTIPALLLGPACVYKNPVNECPSLPVLDVPASEQCGLMPAEGSCCKALRHTESKEPNTGIYHCGCSEDCQHPHILWAGSNNLYIPSGDGMFLCREELDDGRECVTLSVRVPASR